MEPGAVIAAQAGDFVERIDRAGIDGAGRGDDQPRPDPGGAILLQRRLERSDRHAVACIRGDLSLRRLAPAGDVQRLVDAMMSEARGIDGASAVGIAGVAGRDDRRQIGDAPAGGQGAGGAFGIADDARQPGGRGIFQPHRAGAGRGEAGIFVGHRRQQVAERRGKQAAAGNIGHEARRRGGEAGRLDAGRDIVEHRVGVAAFLGKFRIEPARKDFGPGAIARRVRDLLEIGERMVEHALAQHLAFTAVRLQRPHRQPQPFDFLSQIVDHGALDHTQADRAEGR